MEDNKTNVAPEFDFELELIDDDAIKLDEGKTSEEPQEEVEVKKQPEELPEFIDLTDKIEESEKDDDLEIINDEKKETSETSADDMALGIYKTMVDKGWTREREDFKGTFEELDEIFENLPTALFESHFEQQPEFLQNLMKYAYTKGSDLDEKDMVEFFNQYNTIEENSINLENVDDQISFVKKELSKDPRFKDDADELVELWEEQGKLENKAKELLELKKSNKAKLAEQKIAEAQAEKEKNKEAQKQFISSVTKAVNETKWSPRRKQTVLEEIFKGRMNQKSKIINQHPKALYQLADFMTYFNEETGEFDLSTYKKQAFGDAAENVKSTIAKNFNSTRHVKSVNKNPDESNSEGLELII